MVRKRFAVAGAIAALGIALLGLAPPALGQEEPKNASQFCTQIFEPAFEAQFGAPITHGACVALVTAENPVPLFSAICKSPELRAAVEEEFDVQLPAQHGQCVKALKELVQSMG